MGVQTRALARGAGQDRELVAQQEVLGDQVGSRPQRRSDEREDQHEPFEHAGSIADPHSDRPDGILPPDNIRGTEHETAGLMGEIVRRARGAGRKESTEDAPDQG
jgi:hypothetical protein